MNNGDPLERMLNELAELFKLVDENKHKPIHETVTPEIQARLQQLKEIVNTYSDVNKTVFEGSGVKQSDLDQIIKYSSPKLSPKQKKILEFSKKLKADVEAAKDQLRASSGTENAQFSSTKQSAEDVAKRKKKFKRVGGDKWV